MRTLSALATLALLAGCGAPPPAANDQAADAADPAAPAPATPPDASASAAAELPAAFRGTYDRDSAACARPSEYRLRVEPGRLRFHESIGTIRTVRIEDPRRVSVTADYQGEGESWTATHRLTLLPDGSRLTIEGESTDFTRVRCAERGGGWDSSASGEGAGLTLSDAGGDRLATLFCPAGRDVLLVNVPAFRPVGSEERMSFGAGGTVTVLVADTAGDRRRGGVSGEGAVPAELGAILASPAGIAVNYGAQNAGPFPPVPAEAANAFLAGCRS